MDNQTKKKASFTGTIGFVLAAAGSAVGLGNIWRFPYLAAQNGGGLFILIYILLALTCGFVLLITDIAIGRKTGKTALEAFGAVSSKFKFLGALSTVVPTLILAYYAVIGGWILKYMVDYFTGQGAQTATDGYFGAFLASPVSPIIYTFIFLAATALIVYKGVEKGIEKFSKVIMPGLILLIIGIAVFSVTRSYTDPVSGVTRTGLEGMYQYFVPNFDGMTVSRFFKIVMDAMCQLFYSLSVAMGIMITYGSYVKKDTSLTKSVIQIEAFDSGVAILAGLMILPAAFVFNGSIDAGAGPGLIFVALPKIFEAMGTVGHVAGALFFVMVVFAALTSCISLMETVVAGGMTLFKKSRKQVSWIAFVVFAAMGVVVCLGYNLITFRMPLPPSFAVDATTGTILDILDFFCNYIMLPIISLGTCILIGWVKKPQWIISEIEEGGKPFKAKAMYSIIIRYVAPVIVIIMLFKATGKF